MAVQFDKGVVIGADSRTTTGSYIVRILKLLSSTKLTNLSIGKPCHRQTHPSPRPSILLSIWLSSRYPGEFRPFHKRITSSNTIQGCRRHSPLLSSDVHVRAPSLHIIPYSLTPTYSRQQTGSPPPVHTAATLFQKMCYENKDQLSAGIIVAGWDKETGPSVYNIPLGGGLFRQPWAIGGSGSTYVYGYCDATYKEGWGQAETVEFVKNSMSIYWNWIIRLLTPWLALALAMSRDGSSGGVIRMAVITEEGVERLFIPGNELPRFWVSFT